MLVRLAAQAAVQCCGFYCSDDGAAREAHVSCGHLRVRATCHCCRVRACATDPVAHRYGGHWNRIKTVLNGRAMFDNFVTEKGTGTAFTLIDRRDGTVRGSYKCVPGLLACVAPRTYRGPSRAYTRVRGASADGKHATSLDANGIVACARRAGSWRMVSATSVSTTSTRSTIQPPVRPRPSRTRHPHPKSHARRSAACIEASHTPQRCATLT